MLVDTDMTAECWMVCPGIFECEVSEEDRPPLCQELREVHVLFGEYICKYVLPDFAHE